VSTGGEVALAPLLEGPAIIREDSTRMPHTVCDDAHRSQIWAAFASSRTARS
jgi:hypothetical protein